MSTIGATSLQRPIFYPSGQHIPLLIIYVVVVALSTHCIFMLQISFILEKKWPWDDGSLKLSKFIEMNAT